VFVALLHAAFHMLPPEEQASTAVQKRLAKATLGGREDLLTECLIPLGMASDSDSDPDDNTMARQFNGPTDTDEMPISWSDTKEGRILMEKALEIWSSVLTARKFVQEAEDAEAGGTAPSDVLATCQKALDLACFGDPALTQSNDAPHWDECHEPRTLILFARVACCAARACLALGNGTDALQLAMRVQKHVPAFGSGTKTFAYRPLSVRVQLLIAKILIVLGRFAEARGITDPEAYGGIVTAVDAERRHGCDDALEAELAEGIALHQSIAEKRGVMPMQAPVPSVVPGYFVFKHQATDAVNNALKAGEHFSFHAWPADEATESIEQLHVKWGGESLKGISEKFPAMRALVLQDCVNVGYRFCYNLEPLAALASQLTRLELDLSDQWMSEGEDPLVPLASLTKLRKLYLTRLRDGESTHLRAFEKLLSLEHLRYDGKNSVAGYYSVGSDDDERAPVPAPLDLSSLTHLVSVVFVEASFCAVSEQSPAVQGLVLPHQVKALSHIEQFGGKISDALCTELDAAGIALHQEKGLDYRALHQSGDAPAQIRAFWDRVAERSMRWFPTDAGSEDEAAAVESAKEEGVAAGWQVWTEGESSEPSDCSDDAGAETEDDY
jgi:hypothetical protein